MVRVIAVAISLAISAAACGGGSSSSNGGSSSPPPNNHGGYGGKQEKIYDAAYRVCYRQRKQGMPTSDPMKRLYKHLVTPLDFQASQAGCNAGLKATGIPITVLGVTTIP
jgi:hypothetical protein